MDTFGDDLYPLALLMDELKHDDVSNRVEAMQKVDTIAIALGPERTRKELLPFLNDVAQDDEEEVFTVLGTKLGDFVPLIGGHEYSEPLVSILTILASMEEPLVRDKAIDSLNKISLEMTQEEINKIFLNLITNLTQGNWFLKKIASCGLYKAVIIRVNAEVRKDLLKMYLKLVTDDYPMVRRAAATNLPHLIDLLTEFTEKSPNDVNKVNTEDWEIISKMFQHLINDDQDSVKFLSVDVLISILEFFQKIQEYSFNSDFLSSALKLIKDDSWRVRYTAADRFSKIATNFAHNEQDLFQLIDPFITLMKDHEGEVRKAIAKQLPAFCNLLTRYPPTKATILNKIIPVVNELSQDPQENVRASLASSITELSPILEKQATIDKLLPVFLDMLKDEFPDVRLNIISNLSVVNETIGINLLSTNLLPAITELAQDHKWRVRLAIIEYIPKLADQLGESFFNNELLSLCMSWLWDPVYAIREAAVNNLKNLTIIFGSQWATREILSRLLNQDDSIDEDDKIDYTNFIIRITCLFTITSLIPVINHDVLVEKALPFINSLITDSVPNIRFNVAKSYLTLVEALAKNEEARANPEELKKLINLQILSNLEKLESDDDIDVRFYAAESIKGINQLMAS
ncbi:protein phosphatase PP2A regulatory subunit A [Lodderomyces elongisporus NRRL YB-4239]|uniref:Protein phosphatase PP2A regulatory subunit A n=1 Tax=Lodderomyces elongisporus (strain ATCC 11503 / CBS 2605 / JCM 1781 / NBRC 1676 / NRRL YB-4239) TaxID=379508 RepID=A5E078_LODEL|nr:protein phosphatase PP2A regulatory subunit A [Lodderomyces elongisporus NRRL YB-4239]